MEKFHKAYLNGAITDYELIQQFIDHVSSLGRFDYECWKILPINLNLILEINERMPATEDLDNWKRIFSTRGKLSDEEKERIRIGWKIFREWLRS